ncbi:MAG TPA: hypothetical protein PLN81_00190 [Bacillota bacterium]|nr:hypothetical protein [Bacillota bacterium]HPT59996.1 hypothetical protein [Bacillota bacterium]
MKKTIIGFFCLILIAAPCLGAELMQMGGAGIGAFTGLDAVLYNPAALVNLTQRYVGGSYIFDGGSLTAIGYLEPGFSERYNPSISPYRLAGGITWVRDPADTHRNRYYYSVALCTEPVFGGVNLIYKQEKGKTGAFRMDVAVGARFFERLTTTLSVENLIGWTIGKEAAYKGSPNIRLGASYALPSGFLASIDASTKLQQAADISLGAAYRFRSFAVKGGVTLTVDTQTTKVTPKPGLGFSYTSVRDETSAFDLDLALSYVEGRIAHSASFGYRFH